MLMTSIPPLLFKVGDVRVIVEGTRTAEQIENAQCTWCGIPTLWYCDGIGCEQRGYFNIICAECEKKHRVCKVCSVGGLDRKLSNKHSHKYAMSGESKIAICAYCDFRFNIGRRCGSCKRAYYCNETCQQLDWKKRHKKECCEFTKASHNAQQKI